jgi:alpha-1,6-mannosyltransferase
MPKQGRYLVASILLAAYIFVSYILARHETLSLLLSFSIIFVWYAWVIFQKEGASTNFWINASILFRVAILFSIPNLSDDVFRFIWDGRLLAAGYHPFAHIPSYYIESGIAIPGINQELYQPLNSQQRFTIYPPLAQGIFYLATVFTPDSIFASVIVMKLCMLLAELGTIIILKKLLHAYRLPAYLILIYALNPLVILEFTGNLHFEGFMIFFLVLSFYLLHQNKLWQSALIFSLSVATKLIPLIFLPALLFTLGWRKAIYYYFIVGVTSTLLFIPLLTSVALPGFKESLALYFAKFEFNASLYYLVREWGFWKYGYNIIQTVGWKLSIISTGIILSLSFLPFYFQKKYKMPDATFNHHVFFIIALLVLATYLFFSTTVHPWYITPLILFSLFTPFRFPIIWSLFIFGTYAGYSISGYQENYLVITLEYLIVVGYMIYELLRIENRRWFKYA